MVVKRRTMLSWSVNLLRNATRRDATRLDSTRLELLTQRDCSAAEKKKKKGVGC